MPARLTKVSKRFTNLFGLNAEEQLKPSLLHRFFSGVAMFALFTGRYFVELIKPPYEFNELLKQSYRIGFLSLQLVGITGFIMGLVLTVQTRPTLAEFGAESWHPAMISVSIVREIGPVITALICAGKVSSSIGAELASMRVSEQIDAMEVSGINPFKYIIVTRVLATTLMLPILTVFNDIISMLGSLVGVNILGKVSYSLFFAQAFAQLSFTDVFPSLIKTGFFGFFIGLIACYKGYYANKGTVGVGEAANSSVVITSLMVFIIDVVAVQVTSLFIET
jgi:phospholipid/cholesterol/gamma-HCH transport system permease protein